MKYIIPIAIITIGLFFLLISLNNNLSVDEPDFVKGALAIKKTGSPEFYHSEQQPNELALWHPPMYIFLLSYIFKFSTSEAAARSINLIFTILTAILIFSFCKNFFNKQIGLLSTAFFLINYYVISLTKIIDIDILSAFFTFAFIYSFLLYQKNSKIIFLTLSGVSLFFSIFNRYPMAFIAFISIGIYLLVKDRKSLKPYLTTTLSTGVIFLIIWTFYSTLIEPGNFFYFLNHNARLGAIQISEPLIYFGSFIINIMQFIRLFTFPATILLIFSIIFFIKNRNKTTSILMIYSLSIFLFFILIPRPSFGFPRHFLTSIPAFSILIGAFSYNQIKTLKPNIKILTIINIAFILSLLILIFLNVQPTLYIGSGLIKSTNLPDFLFSIFAVTPLFLILLISKDKQKAIAVIILLTLTLSYSLFFNTISIHNPSTREAGLYIKSNTSQEDVIIAPKSVAFYAERKFYANEDNKPVMTFSYSSISKYIQKSLEDRNMQDSFFWPDDKFKSINEPKPSQTQLEKVKYLVLYHKLPDENPEKVIGGFYIYKN